MNRGPNHSATAGLKSYDTWVHKKNKLNLFFVSASVNTRFKRIKPKRCLTSFFTKKKQKNLQSVSDLEGVGLGLGGRL